MGTTVSDIARTLERWAPLATAQSYDNVGLQIGRGDVVVTGGMISLDLTPGVIKETATAGANLIITHHPLFFDPIKSLTPDTLIGSMALSLAEMGIAHYAIHTNLDAAQNGVSFALAHQLGIQNPTFLIAPDSAQKGEGSRHSPGASETGIGTIGELAEPVSLQDFLCLVSAALDNPSLRHTGDPDRPIQRVAVCGGSGSTFLGSALARGADAYVTGDVKYHQFFDALSADGRPRIAFIDAGHYETEAATEEILLEHLTARHSEIRWSRTRHRTSPIQSFVYAEHTRSAHGSSEPS